MSCTLSGLPSPKLLTHRSEGGRSRDLDLGANSILYCTILARDVKSPRHGAKLLSLWVQLSIEAVPVEGVVAIARSRAVDLPGSE